MTIVKWPPWSNNVSFTHIWRFFWEKINNRLTADNWIYIDNIYSLKGNFVKWKLLPKRLSKSIFILDHKVWTLWQGHKISNHIPLVTKGSFHSKNAFHFSNLPISKNKCSEKLSWAWNLNFLPISVNNKFKFQAQDSFWNIFSGDWDTWKIHRTFWKKATFNTVS